MKINKLFTITIILIPFFIYSCNMMNNRSSSLKYESGKFDNPLTIPAVLEPTIIDGVKNYDLKIQKSTHEFFKGYKTNTYGVNTSFLGPTLRFDNGDKVSLNFTNLLNEATTMHGHGMHVPANMDGGPHQKIMPSQSWSAKYTVKQKAATNWYHPHLMGKTAEHVYKGLAGFIIIEDDEIKNLDLPKTYGVDDIPLVLQDRFFSKDGQFVYSPNMREVMHGYNGDIFLTNGVFEPFIDLKAKEIRFRILNGSNSSVYNLKFSNNQKFKQIATDNSLLETSVELTSLLLSPGERAEIIINLTNLKGKSIYLEEIKTNKSFLKINIENTISLETTTTPNKLTNLNFYNIKDAKRTRKFTLSGRMGNLYINGRSMDMNYINEEIPVGKVEIWEVNNTMNTSHNFHIHATHFIIIERNGSKNNVKSNEKGYKDTVYLAPNERVKLLVKMTDYTDNKNTYMYHCHFLEHEDNGMMGQFTVVE